MYLLKKTQKCLSRYGHHFLFAWLVLACVGFHSAALNAADVILVIRPDKPNTFAHASFESAMEGLLEGVNQECLTFAFHLGEQSSTSELRIFLDVVNPKLVVLMDNKSVRLYRQFQVDFPAKAPFVPSVILMSLFVDRQVNLVENSIAIEYQIQGITSLVNFRSLIDAPIDRVGVIYREETRDFFKHQKEICQREEIELVGFEISDKDGKIRPRDVRGALKKLLAKEKVDALWMLNDSMMINRKLLETAWRPLVRQYSVPVIVGIERFVTEEDLIGHFAVVPDPFAMGYQAAEIILSIRDEKWRIGNDRIRLPIGVYKLLNKKKLTTNQAKKLNEKGLLEVDRIIQ